MKILVLKFEDGVDLSVFAPDTAVAITAPAEVAGEVLANATASNPAAIDGTYNITAV